MKYPMRFARIFHAKSRICEINAWRSLLLTQALIHDQLSCMSTHNIDVGHNSCSVGFRLAPNVPIHRRLCTAEGVGLLKHPTVNTLRSEGSTLISVQNRSMPASSRSHQMQHPHVLTHDAFHCRYIQYCRKACISACIPSGSIVSVAGLL